MNIYLQIEGATGNLYEYSKEEQEGYKKYEATNKQTGAVTTTFRKYYDKGAFGKLTNITTRESKIGLQLAIALEALNGDNLYLSIQLQDGRGNVSSFATSVIAYMPALVAGKEYRIFPYVIENKEKTRKNYGVSIKIARLSDEAVDDTNLIARLTYEQADKEGNITVPGDIPRIEWGVDFKGSPDADYKKRNSYLWKVMQDNPVGDPNGAGGPRKTFDSTAEPGDNIEAPLVVETPAVKVDKTIANGDKGAMKPSIEFEDAAVTSLAQDMEDDDLVLPF